MRISSLSFLVAPLALSFVACADTNEAVGPDGSGPPATFAVASSGLARETAPTVSDADLATFVADQTAFALDLYREVATGQGNVVVSPHSVSSAMAMTWAGAKGTTATEMATALHFTLPPATQHAAFNAVDLALASRGQGAAGKDGEPFRLRVVNSAWTEKTYTFEPAYLDTLAVNYGAGVNLLDFLNAADASRLTINAWVSTQTEARIPDLLPEGSVTGDTRLVLTNAVYFNASWSVQFDPDDTTTAPFRRADGVDVDVPMMGQTETLRHAATNGWTAVELPYDGEEVAMLLVAPDSDFFTFQDSFDATVLAAIDAALAPTRVDIRLPRFEYRQATEMRTALTNLGINDLFLSGAADLSGMDGGRDLFVTGIFHEAFIALDETGTEAAAATAVVVGTTSVPPPPVPANFDRPFIYLIRDVPTGAIIFVGRVTDPTKH